MPARPSKLSDFPTHWKKLFAAHKLNFIEFVSSIREPAINHFLNKHFQKDRDRYTITISKPFEMKDQSEREVTVSISAMKALQVELPPLAAPSKKNDQLHALRKVATSKRAWTDLTHPEPRGPQLFAPSENKAAQENLVVYCPRLDFLIEWPKWDSPNDKWSWKVEKVSAVARAYIDLQKDENRYFVRIVPVKMKFDRSIAAIISRETKKLSANASKSGKKLGLMDEKKFEDLLLIALNIVGTEYAPRLIRDIEITPPIIADRPIFPAFLDLSEKTVTIGASLDQIEAIRGAQEKFDRYYNALMLAIESDIAAAGGLLPLVASNPPRVLGDDPATVERLRFYSRQELRRRMKRTRALLVDITGALEQPRTARTSKSAQDVKKAVAFALNEYVLDLLAQNAMPHPTQDCTEWLKLLDTLRGRLCYWARLFNPDVQFNGINVTGDVQLDVGAKIEACIRKFWDCSWRWECGDLRAALQGSAGASLFLKAGAGVRFYGKLRSDLRVVTNVPWPFNKIIEALSHVIIEIAEGIINIFLAVLEVEILPPDIAIPGQNTKIRFRNFTPFPLLIEQGASPRQRLIGFDMDFGAV